MHDLEPAAIRLVALLEGVSDDRLGDPSPCENYPVAAILDHLMGLTAAFTGAAEKRDDATTNSPPVPSATELDPAWREQLPVRLDALVQAWRNPDAWDGDAKAGGVTFPAPVMATVALQEVVIHSWDLARATGQPYDADPEHARILYTFLAEFSDGTGVEGMFDAAVPVPTDAPLFDRVIGLTGRDPAWKP